MSCTHPEGCEADGAQKGSLLLPSGDLANEMFAFADTAVKAQADALREP
jgi:hypothetical protein